MAAPGFLAWDGGVKPPGRVKPAPGAPGSS